MLKKNLVSLFRKKLLNNLDFIFGFILILINNKNVERSQFRFFRVWYLKRKANKLVLAMQRVGFKQDILLQSNGKILTYSSGIFLDTAATNRYLKVVTRDSGNEGLEICKMLRRYGVIPDKKVLDIGANVGEVSIYFSKLFPNCEIHAIEPSKRNLDFFKKNLALQSFSVDNIIIHEFGVGDGSTSYLSQANAQSSLVSKNSRTGKYDLIQIYTLKEVWKMLGLENVNFIKIDIEGAEPQLIPDITDLAPLSASWLIEFGPKASKELYYPLFDIFHNHSFNIFSRSGGHFTSTNEAKKHWDSARSEDYYFIKN